MNATIRIWNRRSLLVLALAAVASTLGEPALAEGDEEGFLVRRYMVSIGNNMAGPGRVELRYAQTDAEVVSRVFSELGGVAMNNQTLLRDPGRTEIETALEAIGREIALDSTLDGRTELLVYYSGHSDETGLLLGEERFPYTDLRGAVDALNADVRIVILDSCSSGALTRAKGGEFRPPFMVDSSSRMTGHAFLTSASDDEAAQESDRIEGSYFTHALVSGLRGAADATGDKKITLNEAYQFAFNETLYRTERTRIGAQHPAYDIQLVGAGDLVMTDLRETSAGLILGPGINGRLRIRDENETLVLEMQKAFGRTVELGVAPGSYTVILEQDGLFAANLELEENVYIELSESGLVAVEGEPGVARGAVGLGVGAAAATAGTLSGNETTPPEMEIRPFSFTLFPVGLEKRARQINEVSLNLTVGYSGGVKGFELSGIGNVVLHDVEGVQLAGYVNYVEGNLDFLQVASLANYVQGDLRGLQFSSLFNGAGNLRGIQGASFLNYVQGRGETAQFAGFSNFTGGKFEGAQFAGVANFAGELRGAQVSVINIAGDVTGSQVGILNLGRKVTGTQIGIVNVADEVNGAPIGLASIVRKGRHNVAAWGSDVAPFTAALKLGNEYVYSIGTIGTESFDHGDRNFFGLGLGGHIPINPKLFCDIEGVVNAISENGEVPDQLHTLTQFRVGVGYQLLPRLAFLGGASANIFASEYSDGDWIKDPSWYNHLRNDGVRVKSWPGFFFGVQF